MTIKTHGRMFTDKSVSMAQINVTDGTDGQALVTDGSGALRFATVGVGGSVGSSTYIENIFAGDDSKTKFQMTATAAVEESILVFVDGVAQPTTTFTLSSSGSGIGANGALDEINITPAIATGQKLRVCHLGINTAIADNSITGSKIAMTGDQAGDIMYYSSPDYARLGIGTAGQHLATNAGATAPEWVTPTVTAAPGTSGNVLTSDGTNWASATPTTPQSANEIAYVVNTSVQGAGTWTKPAGINRIFLYITDRISNDGAGQASFIYLDVTNVTSYAYNVYTYGGSPTKYGALTFNGRTGSSSSFTGSTAAEVLDSFKGLYPGPPTSTDTPQFYIVGYVA